MTPHRWSQKNLGIIGDLADRASLSEDQERDAGVDMVLSYSKRKAEQEIEVAIFRDLFGEPSVCEDCGEEISAQRLRAIPGAIRCRKCEEMTEPQSGGPRGFRADYGL